MLRNWLQSVHKHLNEPRCVARRSLLYRAIAPAITVLVAMYIGWTVYRDDRWAEITELAAFWHSDSQRLEIHLEFTKLAECRRVIVSKHLVPIENNVVIATNPIPVEGTLSDQMSAAPLGTTHMVDYGDMAEHPEPLEYGEYLLAVIASCEDMNADLPLTARIAVTVTTTVVVSDRNSKSLNYP